MDWPSWSVAGGFGALLTLILTIRMWRYEAQKKRERDEYRKKAFEEYRKEYHSDDIANSKPTSPAT